MTKTVLLVEDNPSDEKLTLRALKRGDVPIQVVVARDGADALDYLFREGRYAAEPAAPPPTLVLLDLKLPRIEGLEVLRRIRTDPRTRFVPVVVLTTSNDEQDKVNAYDFNVAGYLLKPVTFANFVELTAALNKYWTLVELP